MILNIKKPKGLTSHDVVNRVRKITNEKRVGHGGTLDPLAEGVLIVGVGRDSTRKLEGILKDTDKEYLATIAFGATSTTDDAEGEIVPTKHKKALNKINILLALKKFTGTILQTPPKYSAIKVSGKPAYKLARKGSKVKLPRRRVRVKEARLTSLDLGFSTAKVRFVVSSGTYIRSLARDIGKYLGVGGYLKELIRTRVGTFKVEDSIELDNLAQHLQIRDTKEDGS